MNQLTKMLTLLADRHPHLWKRVDIARDLRGPILHHWPEHCFLLQNVAYNLLTGKSDLTVKQMIEIVDGPRLAALAAWRVTQSVYRFDPDLFEELWDTPVTDVPPEIFHRLPEWCIYIDMPKPPYCGVFVHNNYEPEEKLEQIRFLFHRIGEKELLTRDMAVIALDRPTLQEGFESTRERIRKLMESERIPAGELMAQEAFDWAANAASLALYLCCEEAEYVRRQLPAEKRTKKGTRLFPPDKPEVIEVGIRMGALLRKGKSLLRSEGNGEGSVRRPHVRRAHYHHFWVGPQADRKLIVKWLPPIFVNIDKGDIETTIRPVGA